MTKRKIKNCALSFVYSSVNIYIVKIVKILTKYSDHEIIYVNCNRIIKSRDEIFETLINTIHTQTCIYKYLHVYTNIEKFYTSIIIRYNLSLRYSPFNLHLL